MGPTNLHDMEKCKKRFSNLRCSDISLPCLRWHTKKNLLLSWFQPSFASKSIFLSHLRSDARGCKERIALRLRPTNECTLSVFQQNNPALIVLKPDCFSEKLTLWSGNEKNPAKMNAGCCYGLFYQRLDSSYISIKPKPGCPIAKDDQYIWCGNLLIDECIIRIENFLLLSIITQDLDLSTGNPCNFIQ